MCLSTFFVLLLILIPGNQANSTLIPCEQVQNCSAADVCLDNGHVLCIPGRHQSHHKCDGSITEVTGPARCNRDYLEMCPPPSLCFQGRNRRHHLCCQKQPTNDTPPLLLRDACLFLGIWNWKLKVIIGLLAAFIILICCLFAAIVVLWFLCIKRRLRTKADEDVIFDIYRHLKCHTVKSLTCELNQPNSQHLCIQPECTSQLVFLNEGYSEDIHHNSLINKEATYQPGLKSSDWFQGSIRSNLDYVDLSDEQSSDEYVQLVTSAVGRMSSQYNLPNSKDSGEKKYIKHKRSVKKDSRTLSHLHKSDHYHEGAHDRSKNKGEGNARVSFVNVDGKQTSGCDLELADGFALRKCNGNKQESIEKKDLQFLSGSKKQKRVEKKSTESQEQEQSFNCEVQEMTELQVQKMHKAREDFCQTLGESESRVQMSHDSPVHVTNERLGQVNTSVLLKNTEKPITTRKFSKNFNKWPRVKICSFAKRFNWRPTKGRVTGFKYSSLMRYDYNKLTQKNSAHLYKKHYLRSAMFRKVLPEFSYRRKTAKCFVNPYKVIRRQKQHSKFDIGGNGAHCYDIPQSSYTKSKTYFCESGIIVTNYDE